MDQNVIDWVQNPFWKENILAADAKRRVGENGSQANIYIAQLMPDTTLVVSFYN